MQSIAQDFCMYFLFPSLKSMETLSQYQVDALTYKNFIDDTQHLAEMSKRWFSCNVLLICMPVIIMDVNLPRK